MGSVSFFSKQATRCPVCERTFHREELRTGRGRLNAGELTRELRRTYIPSEKYGEVHPVIYPVTACPGCYYSAFPADFQELPPEKLGVARHDSERRIESVRPLFGEPDFTTVRGLREGCASYVLAVHSYDYFPLEFAPTVKQGICSLRAAWLASDLHEKEPHENWDYLARVLYAKARFFYTEALSREQEGQETMGGVAHLGPDTDKNYGYDGVVYLAAYLEYWYGPTSDADGRKARLEHAKVGVGKLFGMGKASKNKPRAILDNARYVYEHIADELGLAPEKT